MEDWLKNPLVKSRRNLNQNCNIITVLIDFRISFNTYKSYFS
mgnify:CR=1 FL=1